MHQFPRRLFPAPRAACPVVRRLALMMAVWSAAPLAAQAAHPHGAPSLEDGVDPTVRPGDDFFFYANGAWLQATVIPTGRERWNARTEIAERTQRQLGELLEHAGHAPAGSLLRLVGDFRAAYLDTTTIETRGLAPLAPLLDSLARIPDRTTLSRLLGRGVGTDVDPLNWGVFQSARPLGLAVQKPLTGSAINVAVLVQGGLGLGDRSHYVVGEPDAQALLERYQRYVSRMLALAGADRADARAAAVVALETALAQAQAPAEISAREANADSVWTRADFARRAPGMDWPAFLAAAGLAGADSIVAWQPGALTGLAAEVGSAPLEAWQDYLRFHVLDEYAAVLPRAFRTEASALHGAVSGAAEQPRAEQAFAATELALRGAIGRLYAERYFPEAAKTRVRAVAADVVAALRARVEGAAWMQPATRRLASAKLAALYLGMGYPERWEAYDDLSVDPAVALGNQRRVADRGLRHMLARLGQPADPEEWWMAPHTVAALLLFQQNALTFSAALLQAPKFDPAASDAATYGAIGAIVGHEASHFIDPLGADYEVSGRKRRWWTAADSAGFAAAGDRLARQFSGYHPFPDLGVDGRLTLSENIADLAGLSAAFDAHRRHMGNRVTDAATRRRQDREFFLAFAASWRARIREGAFRTQLKSNDHAPEMFRIATVRNLDAWYEAFDVQPGDKLYLAPAARVRVW